MLKPILLASLCLFAIPAGAASLTEQETRWLRAAAPVLAYSQTLKLPIDIIVQPRPRPSDVPLAMGFDGGRCKLVLSLRANPDAETVLRNVPDSERPLLIEVMAAHEVAHCWRYVQGAWHALPAGFVEAAASEPGAGALSAAIQALRVSRREEAYADLAALAWASRRHPQQYQRVYAWMQAVRSGQPVAGGAHDTAAWLRLAHDPAQFGQAATPFHDAATMWSRGLHDEL